MNRRNFFGRMAGVVAVALGLGSGIAVASDPMRPHARPDDIVTWDIVTKRQTLPGGIDIDISHLRVTVRDKHGSLRYQAIYNSDRKVLREIDCCDYIERYPYK